VCIQSPDLETALAKFNSIDLELSNAFKKIGSKLVPLSSNDRVNLFKDIFRGIDISTHIYTVVHMTYTQDKIKAYLW
jgi:hypothetical protein